MTEYKRSRVCTCGATYEAHDRWQRSCDKCVEAKKAYQAARPRPLRKCDTCGVESRECDHGDCPPCRKAFLADIAKRNRESSKQWRQERNERALQYDERVKKEEEEAKPQPEPKPRPESSRQDDGVDMGQMLMVLILTVKQYLNQRPGRQGKQDESRQDEYDFDDVERHGGRYGFGCKMPKRKPEPQPEDDPDWIDPEEMEAINEDVRDMFEGFDL